MYVLVPEPSAINRTSKRVQTITHAIISFAIFAVVTGFIGLIWVYVRAPQLRVLAGIKILFAAYIATTAIGLVGLLLGTQIAFSASFAVFAVLVSVGLFLIGRQLLRDQVVQSAYFDLESTLPNRSSWLQQRAAAPHAPAYRVTITHIASVRALPQYDTERAFFRWFGEHVHDDAHSIPGFLARLGIRDIGILIQNDPKRNVQTEETARTTVTSFMDAMEKPCRSGGFSFQYELAKIV